MAGEVLTSRTNGRTIRNPLQTGALYLISSTNAVMNKDRLLSPMSRVIVLAGLVSIFIYDEFVFRHVNSDGMRLPSIIFFAFLAVLTFARSLVSGRDTRVVEYVILFGGCLYIFSMVVARTTYLPVGLSSVLYAYAAVMSVSLMISASSRKENTQ